MNRPPTGQSYIPSNQPQTGSQPQNFVPGNPLSGVSPSGIPGQQITPSSGTGYFPGSLPTAQSSGIVYPQPPAYFTPGSPTQEVVPQTQQQLPSNTQNIPQSGSANTPNNFQVSASGFQPMQQSSFTSPSVTSQTGPLSPPNSPTIIDGVRGSSYPPGPQYLIPGTQQLNSGAATPGSQYGQYFPGNTQPAGYYNTGNVNNLSRTPAYFYLVLQPSQQHPQAPQYFLFNTQTVYPQNSHILITNPERPSYSTPTAQLTPQAQPFPQIFPNGQVVHSHGSHTGYIPSSNQNIHQPGYSGGVINPQSQPSTNPSSPAVPQQSSGGTANFPGGSISNREPSIQTGSTNSQPTAHVPQINIVVPLQNTGGVITQPQISTNLPSSSQMQPNSAGGLIYCQSCSYVPATSQHTGGAYPTFQHGSALVPTVQQNSGGPQSQTRPYQFSSVSYPASAIDNQYSTLSQTGLVADPNYPFQAQYIPQIYVPYQQPQVIPTGTQVNQPGTSGYAPLPGTNPNPNFPQEINSVPKNYTNESPTINVPTNSQNGSSINAMEDDIIEEVLSVSSINIVNNATRAEAVSQGKTKNGVVKAEVSGTYTKDFAAKAQIIDKERSAISQIFGNGTGAMSTSYGRAGKSESQSQVLFSHETGTAIAESQGGGMDYNLAGQIQAGIRGGQSDSMATGPGNTFSQAQIGFVPTFKENFLQQSIFQGGGTAISNISRHSGLTDIRFQGQFQSGLQFTGQVQAGAGKVSKNQTRSAFNSTNLGSLSQKDISTSTPAVDKAAEMAIEEERIDEGRGNNNGTPLKLILPQPFTNNSLDTLSDFGTQTSNPQKRLLRGQANNNQKSVKNSWNNAIHKGDPSSTKFLYAGDVIPGTKSYKVPSGFRGRFLPPDVHPSDIQTSVTNSGRMTEIDYRGPSKQGKIYIQKDNLENQQHYLKDGYDGFMTVTKSETGELQNKSRNYDHTYYTKSSTCGFFTYTCNVIDGPDGRTKICKQNSATDINGTPC